MKKEYKKPCICFENFALSMNIAGNCGNGNGVKNSTEAASCDRFYNSSDYNSCYFYDNTWIVFEHTSCEWTPEELGWGDICYDVPSDSARVFSS